MREKLKVMQAIVEVSSRFVGGMLAPVFTKIGSEFTTEARKEYRYRYGFYLSGSSIVPLSTLYNICFWFLVFSSISPLICSCQVAENVRC